MKRMNLTCTICPRGCKMEVDEDAIRGAGCGKGEAFATSEFECPVRILTTTVNIIGFSSRLPVKTDRPIPRALLLEAMGVLKQIEIVAPIRCGQTIVPCILGLDANVVATRDILTLD